MSGLKYIPRTKYERTYLAYHRLHMHYQKMHMRTGENQPTFAQDHAVLSKMQQLELHTAWRWEVSSSVWEAWRNVQRQMEVRVFSA